jgi:hypothetical protein
MLLLLALACPLCLHLLSKIGRKMHINVLRGLIKPLTNKFRKSVPVITPSGEVVFTLQVPSSEVDAEISQIHSEFINQLLSEYSQFIKIEDGSVKLKFDPTVAEVASRRMDASLEVIRSHQTRNRLSYAIVAVDNQEIPSVITMEDGSQKERHEVVFDILSDLPSSIGDYLLIEFRELLNSSAISYIVDAKTMGDLDSKIDIAKQQLSDIEAKRAKELQRTRNQVEEVAQGARVDSDEPSEDDVPPEAVFRFEEERRKHQAHAPAPAAPTPAPTPKRESLATQVAIQPLANNPEPLPQNTQISSIVENGVEIPVYSVGDQVISDNVESTNPVNKVPANSRQSVNPRFRAIPGRLGRG